MMVPRSAGVVLALLWLLAPMVAACCRDPPVGQMLQDMADGLAQGDDARVCRHVDYAGTSWQHDWDGGYWEEGTACSDFVAHVGQQLPWLAGGRVAVTHLEVDHHNGLADATFTTDRGAGSATAHLWNMSNGWRIQVVQRQ